MQGFVAHPVKRALELENFLPAGDRAREPERAANRLAPRAVKTHGLGTGHAINHGLGQLNGAFVKGEVARAVGELATNGLNDGRVGVPQYHGPRAQQVINVIVTVAVGHYCAAGRGHEQRVIRKTGVAAHARGKQPRRLLEQPPAALCPGIARARRQVARKWGLPGAWGTAVHSGRLSSSSTPKACM